MNQQQLDELLVKAQPLLGSKLPVRTNCIPEIVDYTFTEISNAFGIAEAGGQKNYSIRAKLVADNGDVITEPLYDVVKFLESQKN